MVLLKDHNKTKVIKSLFAYLCLLIGSDLLINVAISIAQGSPGEMIMISIVVRMISFAILLSLIGLMVLSLLQKQGLLLVLSATSAVVYLLIPVVIYLLKEGNDKRLWDIYAEIHTTSNYLSPSAYLIY